MALIKQKRKKKELKLIQKQLYMGFLYFYSFRWTTSLRQRQGKQSKFFPLAYWNLDSNSAIIWLSCNRDLSWNGHLMVWLKLFWLGTCRCFWGGCKVGGVASDCRRPGLFWDFNDNTPFPWPLLRSQLPSGYWVWAGLGHRLTLSTHTVDVLELEGKYVPWCQ